MKDFAIVDDTLAASSMAIGESSNLSQLCQTYSYTFKSDTFNEYTDILAVLAQICIDSAKRAYAIDTNNEIKRIKKIIDVEKHGYPEFWFGLERKNKFAKSLMVHTMENDAKKQKEEAKTNHGLVCPMNFLFNYRFPRNEFRTRTIPLSDFFQRFPLEDGKRRSKKAEELIDKYSNLKDSVYSSEESPILQDEYERLIEDLRGTYIKENDAGVISAIIDRAFLITPKMQRYEGSLLAQHKRDLLNILYRTSPKAFLKCFKK